MPTDLYGSSGNNNREMDWTCFAPSMCILTKLAVHAFEYADF
jgi:hypothetical protein